MKKFILLCVTIVLLFSCGNFNTKKTSTENIYPDSIKIKGWGRLELGMTIEDLPELLNAKKIKNPILKFDNKTIKIVEFISDTTQNGENVIGPNVKMFLLNDFNLTKNIKCDVKIYFYKNKLYEICVDSPIEINMIKNILDIKYGYGEKTVDQPFEFIIWETHIPNYECRMSSTSGLYLSSISEIILRDNTNEYNIKIEKDSLCNRIKIREKYKENKLLNDF